MDNMEYIESHFKDTTDDAQKKQFEKKIVDDASFAEEVAFYISANSTIHQQLQQEKKQRFRELYKQQKVTPMWQPVKNLWQYMAAASVIVAVIVLAWFMYAQKNAPQELAGEYINQNFKTLSVTMGNTDSLQTGLNLYNSGRFKESLALFEKQVQSNPGNNEAKKYAGIIALRQKNYDKALHYFTMLASEHSLYSNPGKLYEAVTLLRRDDEGDKDAAKLLLNEVIAKNLEGKSQAIVWMQKL